MAGFEGAVQASKPRPFWEAPALGIAGARTWLADRAGALDGFASGVRRAPSRIRRTVAGLRSQVVVTWTPAERTSTRSSVADRAAGSCSGTARPWGALSSRAAPASGVTRGSGSTSTALLRPTTWAGQLWSAPGWPRYTACRSNRTHVDGFAARRWTGHEAGTSIS